MDTPPGVSLALVAVTSAPARWILPVIPRDLIGWRVALLLDTPWILLQFDWLNRFATPRNTLVGELANFDHTPWVD